MNIRQAEIAKGLADWLALYSPPRNIAGKPEDVQREMDRLIAVIIKYAPQDGYNGWLQSVLDHLAMQMKTRAWPTVGEIGSACTALRSKAIGPATVTEFDVYELNANRMKAGEPVGEGYLYGREAVEIIARGLIDRETMTRYRSAAFLSRKKAYGEASALTWEAESKERHENAKAARKERVAA